jgi:hypothetical protein
MLVNSIIAGILAVLAVVGAIAYLPARRKMTRACWALQLAEGDDVGPARDAYAKLDRKQLKIGLFTSACYGLGLINTAWLAVTTTNVIFLISLSVAAVGTSVFATCKNNADARLRREADEVRRQRQLQLLRRPSH